MSRTTYLRNCVNGTYTKLDFFIPVDTNANNKEIIDANTDSDCLIIVDVTQGFNANEPYIAHENSYSVRIIYKFLIYESTPNANLIYCSSFGLMRQHTGTCRANCSKCNEKRCSYKITADITSLNDDLIEQIEYIHSMLTVKINQILAIDTRLPKNCCEYKKYSTLYNIQGINSGLLSSDNNIFLAFEITLKRYTQSGKTPLLIKSMESLIEFPMDKSSIREIMKVEIRDGSRADVICGYLNYLGQKINEIIALNPVQRKSARSFA